MSKLHIKKGDNVRVLSGDDRGASGRVLRVIPQAQKAIVEGVNMVRKRTKPNQQNPEGGTVETEAPLHVSKLMVIDPKLNKPTRIGRKKSAKKGWDRYSKKSGNILL